MATDFGTDMREEISRELEAAKEELRVRFEYYFKVLCDKHLELVAQLDEVVHVAETQVKLNQLKVTKAEVSHNLQHNELKIREWCDSGSWIMYHLRGHNLSCVQEKCEQVSRNLKLKSKLIWYT